MRKIPSELDNPIDNILIHFADKTANFHKNLGATPNILTTTSLLLTILAAVLIYNDQYKLAAIIFFLSYFYDCADGNFARKYGMVTKFGDLYDHISDVAKFILIIGVILYKVKKNYSRFILLVPFVLLALVQLGCQEEYCNNDDSCSLSFLRIFCVGDPKTMLTYTRYFGIGTLQLVITFFIWSLDKYS